MTRGIICTGSLSRSINEATRRGDHSPLRCNFSYLPGRSPQTLLSLKAWMPGLLLSECPHFTASQEKDGSGCRDSFPSARASFILTHVV